MCVGGGVFKEYLINIPMLRPPYDNLNTGKGKFRPIFSIIWLLFGFPLVIFYLPYYTSLSIQLSIYLS